MRLILLFLCVCLLILVGCDENTSHEDLDFSYFEQTAIPEDKPLAIVIGDSTSAGWSDCQGRVCAGIEYDWWQDALPDDLNFLNRGVGTSRTDHWLGRVKSLPPTTDFVFVMMGMNDALRGVPAEQILANLIELRRLISSQGATPILLTILPASTPGAVETIQQVNDWLMAYSDAWLVIDAYSALVDPRRPGFLLAEYQSASTNHPTAAGYDRLAEHIQQWWDANADRLLHRAR